MKKRKIYTMSELSAAIMSAFNKINSDWFGGELEKVIITFESGQKKHAYGWIYTQKNWEQNGKERFNINISSDYLDRGVYHVIGTLVHEMCHLYNMQHGIQDTARSGIYHNKKFRDCAIAHGLTCEEVEGVGWSKTGCTEQMEHWIDENIGIVSFEVQKIRFPEKEKVKKPSSTRKYVCPSCGLIVRATKECRIACYECNLIEMILDT